MKCVLFSAAALLPSLRRGVHGVAVAHGRCPSRAGCLCAVLQRAMAGIELTHGHRPDDYYRAGRTDDSGHGESV